MHQAKLAEARQPHKDAVPLYPFDDRVVDGADLRRLVALQAVAIATAAAAASPADGDNQWMIYVEDECLLSMCAFGTLARWNATGATGMCMCRQAADRHR